MSGFLKEMLFSSSSSSSARAINTLGAVTGTLLISYTTFTVALPTEAFGIYMAYCGGVYGVGKYLDKKDTKDV